MVHRHGPGRRGALLPLALVAAALAGVAAAGASAAAATVVVSVRGVLPGGARVEARVGDGSRRPAVAVSTPERRASRRPPSSPRSLPGRARPRRPGAPAPSASDRRLPPLPPRPAAEPAPGADRACLAQLAHQQVPHVPAAPTRGIETPIEITGPIAGVRLVSRGRRPALMDCQLAAALADAAPALRRLGVTGLSFSSTYDYRNVRGTQNLSGHAHGLAIDVHAVETDLGHLDVEREYARDPARWQGTRPEGGPACVGDPPRPQGRLLRALACELRSRRAFRLIITPDDNHDHRNHLHIEANPRGSYQRYSARPGASSPSRYGRQARR